MGTLVILFCQALDLGTSLAEDWPPPASDPSGWAPAKLAEERISLEAFAIYTKWDPGIRIEDGWGFGADLKIGVNWVSAASLVARLGYAGWSTENDDSKTFPGHTDIAQYRFGVGGDFSTRHFDFGIYLNFGLYHFHARHVDNDTAFFVELEATAGYKPFPFLKLGLAGMVTFVNSNFNRASTHFFTNESIGPAVEVKFDF